MLQVNAVEDVMKYEKLNSCQHRDMGMMSAQTNP